MKFIRKMRRMYFGFFGLPWFGAMGIGAAVLAVVAFWSVMGAG